MKHKKNNNIRIQVNVPFIFVMVLEIHKKPQFFYDKQLHFIFFEKIACAEIAEPRMTVSYTTLVCHLGYNGLSGV